MPDLPDIHTPLPDEAHEAIRAGLVTALDDLADQVQRINDAWLLLLGTSHFAQATLDTVQSATRQLAAVAIRIDAVRISADTALDNADALQTALAALTHRVTALEAR